MKKLAGLRAFNGKKKGNILTIRKKQLKIPEIITRKDGFENLTLIRTY